MSGKNARTWQPYHVGHFLLTIQLDSVAVGRRLAEQAELGAVTRRLIALAESQRLPITWAVSDPAHSAATSLILQSSVDHELAILGDANWVGPTAGRTRFARELARRVAQARAAGIELTSLVPHVASIEKHVDLVVKQRITAVAGVAQQDSHGYSTSPRAMHYGVWEMPISEGLPRQSNGFLGGKWATWRHIRRAARDAGTFHLVVDAPALLGGRHLEKSIEWFARRVALFRDRGMLCIETLRSMATRLADVPVSRPQRSILHAAA